MVPRMLTAARRAARPALSSLPLAALLLACGGPPRPVDPADDPQARAEAWSAVERCPAGTDLTGAVARLACLEAGRPALRKDPAYLRMIEEEQRAAGERLAAAAAAPEAAERPGARYLLAAGAACLAPERGTAGAAGQARDELIERIAPAFHVQVSAPRQPSLAPPLEDTCERLAGALGGAIRCRPGDPRAVAVEVEIALGKPDHAVRVASRAIKYEVRRDVHPNPGHRAARERVRMAQASFEEVELPAVDAEQRCEAARRALVAASYCYGCPARDEEVTACEAADSIRAVLERRRGELDAARAELAGTAEVIETPVYETGHYTERLHRWQAHGALRVLVAGRPVHDERPVLSWEDTEHDGFQPAAVAPDPLAPPAASAFQDRLHELARGQVERVFRAALALLAAERQGRCGERTEWTPEGLECRAEYYLLSGQQVSPGFFGAARCR